jgi:hypothetical protein
MMILYTLIAHPEQSAVLLLYDGQGWHLPFVTTKGHYSESATQMRLGIKEQLGIDINVLRWIAFRGGDEDRLELFYIVEIVSPTGELPDCWRWFKKDGLPEAALDTGTEKIIDGWLDELEGNKAVPPEREPWGRSGWWGPARKWIADTLAGLEREITGEIEEVKVWQRSCVLSAPTREGLVFFKAVPEGLRVEMAVTQHIARHFPRHAPVVLAYDQRCRWMLSADMQGKTLWNLPDEGLWEQAVCEYARLQIACIPQAAHLPALDCPVRRVEDMPQAIRHFQEHALCFQAGKLGEMSPEEKTRYAELLPRILEDCRSLAEAGLPVTLEHGDLNPMNIVVTPRGMVFFDWSDCSLSHPFFSLAALFGFLDRFFAKPQEVKAQLSAAYLKEWHGLADQATLEKAFAAAQRLAWLHNALTFHQRILPVFENPEEFIGTEALFVRFMMERYNSL